jgi:hypothetical protein
MAQLLQKECSKYITQSTMIFYSKSDCKSVLMPAVMECQLSSEGMVTAGDDATETLN